MATYTPKTIAKAASAFATAAFGAAVASAHGVDLSTLDVGDWLGVVGTGLVSAGAVFATPNKAHQSATEQINAGIQTALQNQAAAAQVKTDADAEVDTVTQLAATALGLAPTVLGPLAAEADKLLGTRR